MEDMALDTPLSDHDDELLLLVLLVVSVFELLFDGNFNEGVDIDIQSVAESTVCQALFIHDKDDEDWSIAAVSEFNWGALSAAGGLVWNFFNQEDVEDDEDDDVDAATNDVAATGLLLMSSLSLSLSSWNSGIESDPKYWEPAAALASRWYFIRSSRRLVLGDDDDEGDGGVLLLWWCSFLRDIR